MDIRFYRSQKGASPVEEYLDSLGALEVVPITAALQDITLHGIDGTPVKVRPIQGKLWELKISQHRIFYFLLTGPEMVLLHAYKKQGKKAPKRHIDLAKKRMKEVLASR